MQCASLETFEIRTPTAGDAPAVVALVERCSVPSRYARFLAPVVRVPSTYVDAVTSPGPGRWSWSVVRAGSTELLALASLFADGPSSAEVSVLVVDDWQRRGLGTLLLALAIGRARDDGVRAVHATTLSGSGHTRRMLARHGEVTSRLDGPTVSLCLDLGARAKVGR